MGTSLERDDIGFFLFDNVAVHTFGVVLYLLVCSHCRCGGSRVFETMTVYLAGISIGVSMRYQEAMFKNTNASDNIKISPDSFQRYRWRYNTCASNNSVTLRSAAYTYAKVYLQIERDPLLLFRVRVGVRAGNPIDN